MTAQPRFGLRAVALAAPPSQRLAREIGLEPLRPRGTGPAPAPGAETPAPAAADPPRRIAASTRAVLAILAGAEGPLTLAEVRAALDRPDLLENTVFCSANRLAKWGFVSRQVSATRTQPHRSAWRATAEGRAFLDLCQPVTDAQILAAVAEIAADPWPKGRARWWFHAAPDRRQRPTTARILAEHFAGQGRPGGLDPTEATPRLAALAEAGHLARAVPTRKSSPIPCYWPA